MFKYPVADYLHYWLWLIRQAFHDPHVWATECELTRRAKDADGRWETITARGAIERCSCGKAREVWR